MRTPIMRFTINNKLYTVYDVDRIEGKETYIVETQYNERIVLVEIGKPQEMIDTLGHELAHVWLYENGHEYQAGGCFTYEEVCEYMSFSWDFISYNVEEYMKVKGWL